MSLYTLNYQQRIKDILADENETRKYVQFAMEHNFYDPTCEPEILVAESYSRYRAYPYLAYWFGAENIIFTPIEARYDFEIKSKKGNRKVDTKVRTTKHTDYQGDVYIDSSKWELNDAIVVIWEDNYGALFGTKTTPIRTDKARTNRCSSRSNTDKIEKNITHFNYKDALYKWEG